MWITFVPTAEPSRAPTSDLARVTDFCNVDSYDIELGLHSCSTVHRKCKLCYAHKLFHWSLNGVLWRALNGNVCACGYITHALVSTSSGRGAVRVTSELVSLALCHQSLSNGKLGDVVDKRCCLVSTPHTLRSRLSCNYCECVASLRSRIALALSRRL